MNFGGHQTFALRDHWLFKGLRFLDEQGDQFSNTEKAIEYLGVGTNMVSAIRYWLLASGVAEIEDKTLEKSQFGEAIQSHDPYFDHIGTSWFVHYHLVTNRERATTWHWFFNNFGVSEFTPDSALHYLRSYLDKEGRKVKDTTLQKDINTLLRMYVHPEFKGKQSPEDNTICPLVDLNLIEEHGPGYRVVQKVADDIPTSIFAYALVDFWERVLGRPPEFSFDELTQKDGSPSKVFSLGIDETVTMIDRLVEWQPKVFSYSRAGGFFSLKIKKTGVGTMMDAFYEV